MTERFKIGTANGECEILETVEGGTRCIAKCYYYQQADRIIHALRYAETPPPEERPIVAYGVRNVEGILHSLTVTRELAERTARQLRQTFVPLLDGSAPQK